MARNYKWLEVGNTRARVDTSARAEFLRAVTWRFSARSTGMKISSRVVEAGMKVHNGLKFQPGALGPDYMEGFQPGLSFSLVNRAEISARTSYVLLRACSYEQG